MCDFSRAIYEKGIEDGIEKVRAEEVTKGIAEGRKQERAETVAKLKQMGMSDEDIKKFLSL